MYPRTLDINEERDVRSGGYQMSVQSTTTFEFNRREAHLSSSDDDSPPYTIHGVALGANDVTHGSSGVKKLWPSDELQKAAETLQGTNLVVDHDNSANGVVGQVTKSGYKDSVGVIYEAELYDNNLADKVKNGLLEVSIRGYHLDVDDMEENDDGVKIVEDIEFDNLSIVPKGAAPSNTLQLGEHAELSAAELAAFTDTLDELQEIDLSDFVQWDDNHGIVFAIDDNTATVEVMEEIDEKWRSVGRQEEVSLDDLEMWNLDESDIGAPKDSEEARHNLFVEGMKFFHPGDDEIWTITDVMDDEVQITLGPNQEGRSWYDPVQEIIKELAHSEIEFFTESGEHNPLITPGLKFFSTINDSILEVLEVQGNNAVMSSVGEPGSWKTPINEIMYDLADGDLEVYHPMSQAEMAPTSDFMFTDKSEAMQIVEDDDSGTLTDVHSHEMDGETMWMPGATMEEFTEWHEMKHSSDNEGFIDEPEFESGMMVQWQANPDMFGKVVHVPEDDDIVMVELYDFEDGHLVATGYTVTAGYGDVQQMMSDMLGRTNVDQYDVSEGDWAQWYPSSTSERHGFVTSVDEDDVTITVWEQNSDGEWRETDESVTKSMEEVEPWGNFPREQEDFAIDGADPRRAVRPSEEAQDLSEQTETALRNKVEAHNEEYGDADGKRVTYRMLKSVYNRGGGAYDDSHREGMSRQQWSMARVNAFLYLLRNGNPENDAYVQDNDLLPDEHPRSTSEENGLYGTPASLSKYDYAMGAPELTFGELASMDELDVVYANWTQATNMTASELRRWSKNPCSREASVDPTAVIKRNLRLLETDKQDWDRNDIRDAKRTVSFIARMRGAKGEGNQKTGGTHGCPTKWAISLLNWAYNPFDSLPEAPEDDSLDDVEEVELMAYEMHEVEFDGVTTEEWSPVSMDDFETDDLEEIAKHFMVSTSGFPPENYRDLKVPVVDPEGNLNLNALQSVKGGMSPSAAEGLGSGLDEKLGEYINQLAEDEFDKNWGMEEAGMYNKYKSDESHMFPNRVDAMMMARQLGLDGVHKMGEMWMPGMNHEAYMDAVASMGYGYGDDDEMQEEEEEMADSESLMDYDMHEPSYEGTTEADWSAPTLEDIMMAYDWDDDFDSYDALPDEAKETIGNHFMISESGFPAENFGDYKLPVVTTDGELSLNALNAVKGGRGVSAVEGLNSEMEDSIVEVVNELANEEFDKDYGMEEEMASIKPVTIDGVTVLTSDDLRQGGKSEESETDSTTSTMTNVSDELQARLEELKAPAVMEQASFDELREKAEKYDDISEDIAELRERTEVLDAVDRTLVDELSEADEPMVIESARFEALSDEAEQVKQVYATQLEDELAVFTAEELMDKFTIEELSAKYEDAFGEFEEELSPDPKGTDANEEELEERASEEERSEEELAQEDAVAQKQEQIRNQIFKR